MEFERRKKAGTELNIAPLIDVVFLLLIFFVLSWRFVAHPAIKITLPSAASVKPHLQQGPVVFISSEGQVYLNEERVGLENLKSRIVMRLEGAADKTVVIKADEKIDLGLAVKVMDIAKQADAEGLVISTRIAGNVK